MTKITFDCDRCKREVTGLHVAGFTSGFYTVDAEGSWSKYARDGEHFVCDDCIQSMPEYRQDYSLA